MRYFRHPDAESGSEDEEFVEEVNYGAPVVLAAGNDSDGDQDLEAGDPDYEEDPDDYSDEDDDDTSEFDPDAPDTADSMDESDEGKVELTKKKGTTDSTAIAGEVTAPTVAVAANADADAKPSGSKSTDAGIEFDWNEDDEDDSTLRRMIASMKAERKSPPDIKTEDFITDICFHPDKDIIVIATITGDVYMYEYDNEGNTLLRTIEVHAKAIRDVEFSTDGRDLLTCSKDKCIMVTDMETEKLKKFYETAHEEPINKLHVIDTNLFATGDDDGTVKLWDLRTKNSIFALKEVEDYVTQILTNDDKKLLLVTSGDGYLTTLNIGARKLYVQSEPYEEELTCMGTYRGDSKLVVGTTKGRLYTYNWGQFGYHSDMYPGIKTPISQMIPITDRIGCVAGEQGIIRACHIAPFRNLGIVGQHKMPIEHMDVNCSGQLIASSSHNNDVCFWNVSYFENFPDIKFNEKHNTHKEKNHNLPSSKFSNASDFFADLANPPSDNGEE